MHLSSVFNHRFRFGSTHPYHHKCMFLLSRFLETNSQGFYGYGIVWDLITGKGWTESPNFPVVTYCDMEIRILGHVQRHTVQCVLVINIFTEKIFLLLWLWYTLLAVISFGSIMSWIFSSLPFDQRKKFIARRLELADVSFKRRNFTVELDEFVRDFVKMDGVFVLRMITIHSGVLICTEVVDTMWDQFLAEQAEKDEYKGDRAPSAGAVSLDVPLRRKTSVLVPLMSREDLTQMSDHLLRPPSRM
ncbi:unnamed protein product [Haemonchus placei]|uniref:Innexin n=1 Tax=Haemonchus placei TaxID=6290 RepID=A0A0N4X1E1_HAEPC|nr:unnamed protein product [Haemonchus placei]